MKSVQNKTGKNRRQNPKPRTENSRTQDVKPKTENREQETSLPLRPVFSTGSAFGVTSSAVGKNGANSPKANQRPVSSFMFPVSGSEKPLRKLRFLLVNRVHDSVSSVEQSSTSAFCGSTSVEQGFSVSGSGCSELESGNDRVRAPHCFY